MKWLHCHAGQQEVSSCHTRDESEESVTSKGIHPGIETQGRCHQKSKTGVSVDPQKGLMYSKFF